MHGSGRGREGGCKNGSEVSIHTSHSTAIFQHMRKYFLSMIAARLDNSTIRNSCCCERAVLVLSNTGNQVNVPIHLFDIGLQLSPLRLRLEYLAFSSSSSLLALLLLLASLSLSLPTWDVFYSFHPHHYIVITACQKWLALPTSTSSQSVNFGRYLLPLLKESHVRSHSRSYIVLHAIILQIHPPSPQFILRNVYQTGAENTSPSASIDKGDSIIEVFYFYCINCLPWIVIGGCSVTNIGKRGSHHAVNFLLRVQPPDPSGSRHLKILTSSAKSFTLSTQWPQVAGIMIFLCRSIAKQMHNCTTKICFRCSSYLKYVASIIRSRYWSSPGHNLMSCSTKFSQTGTTEDGSHLQKPYIHM